MEEGWGGRKTTRCASFSYRFRLSTIHTAEAEAKRNAMEIWGPVMACISDLAFKYTEQLARDLELFSQHGGRKTANMEDVILSETNIWPPC